jgi:predicted NUDIX family NTP pyrophosphohydrolase
MPKKSAGLLLYRLPAETLEVFLGHPGGPFEARKDAGVWSIPKGEIGEDEPPLEAAKREFREETGFALEGDFVALDPIRQSSGKIVYAWAIEGNVDAGAIRSNTFSMEWPPGSGTLRNFPEMDRAGWFPLEAAREKILKGQLPLLDQLERLVRTAGTDGPSGPC